MSPPRLFLPSLSTLLCTWSAAYTLPWCGAYTLPWCGAYTLPWSAAYTLPWCGAYTLPWFAAYTLPWFAAYTLPWLSFTSFSIVFSFSSHILFRAFVLVDRDPLNSFHHQVHIVSVGRPCFCPLWLIFTAENAAGGA